MSDWPRISLVTPSMNQGRFIEATIESVLSQGYPNLEYIVVDGGSSDESVAVIRRYADRLAWWVSETDAGQTDALLKGFSRCTGLVLNWLNADDLLRPGALFTIAQAYRDGTPDLIVGHDRQFTNDPEQPISFFEPSGYKFPDCLRFWTGAFRYHQPCTFFSRAAYERAGELDGRLHYAMDYDFYCRVLSLQDVTVTQLDSELSAFRIHAGAKTSRAKAGFVREMREVSRRYWPPTWSTSEQSEMDRYSAECSLHQAAEALRDHDWAKAARAFQLSLGYDTRQTGRLIMQRLQRARAPSNA